MTARSRTRDINKADPRHIKEFAYMVGVLADTNDAAPDDDDEPDDDVADTPDDNGEDEPDEATG